MKPNKQRYLLAKAVLNYCLIFLLGFSLWGKQSLAPVTDYPQKITLQPDTPIITAADYNNSPLHPFANPFLSETLPEEPEMPDDLGPNNHSYFEWSNLFQNPCTEALLQQGPVKTLFAQLSLAIQNRSTAPLFVLHHSWKSFLV